MSDHMTSPKPSSTAYCSSSFHCRGERVSVLSVFTRIFERKYDSLSEYMPAALESM